MSFGPMLLMFGILCLITPVVLIWLKYRSLDDCAAIKWMSELNLEQIDSLQFLTRSGIGFVFVGGGLMLFGF